MGFGSQGLQFNLKIGNGMQVRMDFFGVCPDSRHLVPFGGMDVGEASEPFRRAREASPTRSLELICQPDIREIE